MKQMNEKRTVVLGTRGSKLALLQAEYIVSKLKKAFDFLEFETKVIKTTGDKILDKPLAKVGGKGLFVKEIEEALVNGEVDLVVHSMKDVPTDVPKGLEIAAVTKRIDCRDCVISKENIKLSELPVAAKIGTSSLRRRAQLLHFRPDLNIVDIRGNLDTRLNKLKNDNLDAVIVAVAGLERMGLEERITEIIPFDICLPAAGQGALGIELRSGDNEIKKYAGKLNDKGSFAAIMAERAFLRELEGGCQIPIGAHAYIENEGLTLEGLVSSLDGKSVIRDKTQDSLEHFEEIGVKLAGKLIERGANEILKSIR